MVLAVIWFCVNIGYRNDVRFVRLIRWEFAVVVVTAVLLGVVVLFLEHGLLSGEVVGAIRRPW